MLDQIKILKCVAKLHLKDTVIRWMDLYVFHTVGVLQDPGTRRSGWSYSKVGVRLGFGAEVSQSKEGQGDVSKLHTYVGRMSSSSLLHCALCTVHCALYCREYVLMYSVLYVQTTIYAPTECIINSVTYLCLRIGFYPLCSLYGMLFPCAAIQSYNRNAAAARLDHVMPTLTRYWLYSTVCRSTAMYMSST